MLPNVSVVVLALKIVVQRAARRQIPQNVAPLIARAQNIHDVVQHLPDVDLAPSAPTFGGWVRYSTCAHSSSVRSLG
jgi:hypothetical protein